MQIELSKHEVEFLDQCLQAFEQTSQLGASFASTLVEAHQAEGGVVPEEAKASMLRVKKKVQTYKTRVLLLRAKLAQAEARDSEHQVEQAEDNR